MNIINFRLKSLKKVQEEMAMVEVNMTQMMINIMIKSTQVLLVKIYLIE